MFREHGRVGLGPSLDSERIEPDTALHRTPGAMFVIINSELLCNELASSHGRQVRSCRILINLSSWTVCEEGGGLL